MTRAPASLLASLGLCVLGGLALSLAFPPAGLWPVAFVALTPLLWTLRAAGPARGALLGLAYGAAFFGATLSWIALFGELAWTALVLLSAASTALFGVLATAMLRPGHPWRSAAGVAALWTAGELLRGNWPLGGFTWGTLGVSQVDDRWLLPLASVTGIAGVTFVVVAANALLVEAAVGGGGARRSVAHLAVAVALVAAPVAIGVPTADGPQLDVATIQVDVRLAEDPSVANEDLEVARLHVEAHAALAADPPDVALWGEGSLDPEAPADPATAEAVRRAIADVGVPTIVGAVVDDADGGQRTSVLAFDGGARLVDRYDKVHLVPFGEYVPFRDRLGWVEAIRQIPVDRVAGDAIGVLDVPGIPPVATPICFENSFPGLPRDAVNAGAEILIVPVNNASYGFTAAAEQHLQMSRARAVETGRWVVNAAISGISAFIEPSGAVVSRTDLFATDILRGTVRSSDARTPFVRLGDWFSWCSVVIAAGLFLAPRRQASTRPPTDPPAVRPRILVIVPTYDERATIADVVRGVLDRDDDVSVLVVDDASPDGTAEVVGAIAATDPRVRL
ncbi:MAG TPA: apolipoprotein N-acyltransferase, partial [Actinomycetota bacterium]